MRFCTGRPTNPGGGLSQATHLGGPVFGRAPEFEVRHQLVRNGPKAASTRLQAGRGSFDPGQCSANLNSLLKYMGRVHVLPDKWLPVSIAPSDADLEVCVMGGGELHAVIFPCRKAGTGWVDAATKKRVAIQPTHWRLWDESRSGA